MIDLNQSHFIGVDSLEGTWRRVPIAELQYALDNNLNILLFDHSAIRYELFPLFGIADYVTSATPEYPFAHISVSDQNVEISAYTLELIKRFHYTWFNALKYYLLTDEFKSILATVKKARASTAVYPGSADMFRVFLTPVMEAKCTWLALSPYQSTQACGISFAVEQGTLPPSLLVLQQGIKSDTGLTLPANFSLDKQLLPLRTSCVFLLNAALTCTSTDATAHVELWSPFIMRVIQVLNQVSTSWVLWGKVAGSYGKYITPGATIHKLAHPSWYARTGTGMETDVFSQLHNQYGIQYT